MTTPIDLDRNPEVSWTPETALEYLKKHYHKFDSKISTANAHNIYRFFDRQLPYSKIYDFLSQSDAYTVHRPITKVKKIWNPFMVYKPRENVQADLIELPKHYVTKANKNVKMLACFIDSFTSRLFCRGLKNKNAKSMVSCLRSVHAEMSKLAKLHILVVDMGLEWLGKEMQAELKRLGMETRFCSALTHAPLAESKQKHLQIMIAKFMRENNTTTYLPSLPRIVAVLNSKYSRRLKCSPSEVRLVSICNICIS